MKKNFGMNWIEPKSKKIEKIDNKTPANFIIVAEEIIDIKIKLNEIIDKLNEK